MGQQEGAGGGLRATLLKSAGTVGCLAGIVATWVAMAEILQSVQDKGGSSYDKPYFMSFLVHSAYAIFFVLWIIVQVVKKVLHQRRTVDGVHYDLVLNGDPSNGHHHHNDSQHGHDPHHHQHRQHQHNGDHGGSDWWAQLKVNWLPTLIYSILVYVVVYTWYLSLSRTFVSVNTAIYNSSCVFVFFFSVAVLKEKVSVLKVVAVVCCLGGVVMLCVDGLDSSNKKDSKNDVWGYVLVIASTILYSLYEVLFKRWGSYKEREPAAIIGEEVAHYDPVTAPHHDHLKHHHPPTTATAAPASGGREQLWKRLKVVEHTMLFIGLLGVWTILLAWPGIIIVDKAGIESFELPHGKSLVGILITMGLDSLFNCLLILGIVLSSPLFISVGSLLTIPASVVCDWLLHGTVLPILSYMGMLAIVAGFLLLTLSEFLHFKWRNEEDHKDKGAWAHLVPSLY